MRRMKPRALAIVYEDPSIVVVDKPRGLLTISDGKTAPENCLYHQVYQHVKKSTGGRIFIVHRLDRDTEGLLVFAKDERVKAALQKQLEERSVRRFYEAIVDGRMERERGTIKVKLFSDRFHNVFVGKHGDTAITEYQTLGYKDGKSLLEIHLITGRRNQIRASLAYLGHPIVGDKKYGGSKSDRLWLRAYELGFQEEAGVPGCRTFKLDKRFSL